jgi:hypothetical protein
VSGKQAEGYDSGHICTFFSQLCTSSNDFRAFFAGYHLADCAPAGEYVMVL